MPGTRDDRTLAPTTHVIAHTATCANAHTATHAIAHTATHDDHTMTNHETTDPAADRTGEVPREADVVVVGMGPGGEDVAGRLAGAGLDVVGVEAELVGGECPYWACIPSKIMVRAGDLVAEARRVTGMAGESTVVPEWGPVNGRVRDATDAWDDAEAVDRFRARGGTLVRGRGRLTSADSVTVGDRTIRARRAIVVATGSRPSVPSIPGLAGTPFWTNREAIAAEELPTSLVVLGGGPVGVELAQVYRRFGATVTIVDVADRLLAAEEPEVGRLIADVFTDEGIDVVTGAGIDRVRHADGFVVELDDGRSLTAEQLLVATGRHVDLGAIGAASIGVDPSASAIPVDEHLRVTDGVWAIGDVTGKGAYTHVAVHQARIAAADILGQPHTPVDYAAVPRVTFTDPEVGAVGLTVAEAEARGLEVVVGRADVATSARGWLHGAGNAGLVQLVVDPGRGVLVGATSVGPAGGEVLGLLTLAVHARVPIEELRTMMYAYPTFHRAVDDAIRDLG